MSQRTRRVEFETQGGVAVGVTLAGAGWCANHVIVESIAPTSVLTDLVNIGDRLLSVNGVDVSTSAGEAAQLLKLNSNIVMTIEVPSQSATVTYGRTCASLLGAVALVAMAVVHSQGTFSSPPPQQKQQPPLQPPPPQSQPHPQPQPHPPLNRGKQPTLPTKPWVTQPSNVQTGATDNTRSIMLPGSASHTAVLGVISKEPNGDIRYAARSTWMRASRQASAGIVARFVILSETASAATINEASQCGDIVFVSSTAGYTAGGSFTVLWWRYALARWPRAQLIGVAEDDVFIHLRGVAAHLRASLFQANGGLFWGTMSTSHWSTHGTFSHPAPPFVPGFGFLKSPRKPWPCRVVNRTNGTQDSHVIGPFQ